MAIISVVVGHVLYFNPNAGSLQAILYAATTTGGMGVSVFFVLSGFLIAQSLLRSGSKFDVFSYTVRRTAKILPPFALTMLLFGGLIAAFGQSDGLLAAALANLASIPNFVRGFREINTVHWSLWIEIQFYIILPIACQALGGLRPKVVAMTALLFLATSLTARLFIYSTVDRASVLMPEWNFLLQRTPGSLDGFSYGMLFAAMFHSTRRDNPIILRYAPVISWSGLMILITTYGAYTYYQYQYGITGKPIPVVWEVFRFLPCLSTALMLFMLYLPPSSLLLRIFSYGPLCLVGVVSYEWYLLHFPPTRHLQDLIGTADGSTGKFLLKTLVPIVATFLLSILLHFGFSAPILRISNRLLKKRSQAASI